MTKDDATRYEIDTILAAILKLQREIAEMHAMMKVLWVILCPDVPLPVVEKTLDS